MKKDSDYYKKQIDLIKQKIDNVKRKRKNLNYGEINKRIMYKRIEEKYNYKLDKYSDLYLYQIAREKLLKSSTESKQLYEKMQIIRRKYNRVDKKKKILNGISLREKRFIMNCK